MISVGDVITFTDEPYKSACGAVLECDACGVVIDFEILGPTRFDRNAIEQMILDNDCKITRPSPEPAEL